VAQTSRTHALTGPLLIGSAAVSVQIGAAVATGLFDRIGPVSTVWLRLGFGAILLLVVARLRRGERAVRFDWRTVIAFGVVVAWMNTCFYEAIARLPLGVAVTIEFLGPLGLAAAMSRRRLDLLWVGLAGCGVAALGSPTADIDPIGALWALGAGLGWAMFALVGRRMGTSGSLLDGLSRALVVATILLTPLGILLRHGDVLAPAALGLGLVVAALSTALPWTLELFALRLTTVTAYGVLVSLEPAVAAIVGALALAKHVGGAELIAIGAVVAASAGATLSTSPPPAPAPPA
jgi:inner membrane transporter RhtA